MSDLDHLSAPFSQVSSDNHAAWLLATSYIMILVSLLVTGVRLIWRYRITGKVSVDDWLITASTILAVAQTISLTVACNRGLGKHAKDVSIDSYVEYSKSFYASQLGLMAATGLAKASAIQTVAALRPHVSVLRACHGLQILNALWIVAGIVALAFQCSLPAPWDFGPERCINQYALVLGLGVINILTDLVIIALPAILMSKVQITNKQRWTVSALFACRVIVPVMTILGMVAMYDFFHSSPPDQTWLGVVPSIYFQLMVNFSIISASIPSIKRFLDQFRSGAFAAEVTVAFEESRAKGYSGSGSGYTSGKQGSENPAQGNVSARSARGFPASEPAKVKVERSESVRGLTDDIIMHTIDFKVEVEDEHETKARSEESAAHYSNLRGKDGPETSWYGTAH
ncbi:uncharacterized protein Z518_05696 [Rhinocladiella mackenziei CBS 650.93]|uniref:Rhinocladiella mackenziei CBS 650.93 unplaced genomic scaffold supercont1.4, whole genome shotgun sequence n=1 Tax=Rhinocladiella mackenziei CBS 650.93 TaxID=1442369 RepID=A0A0D2J6X3_9EURO|nr:uncharacterized protein Z518_05696 [Rhinocladiella mackenziei CBS 650.93]KIX04825.1 hypothetical protein Z518_05696 [Rhinocladiella mackenziei CBS 650.93]